MSLGVVEWVPQRVMRRVSFSQVLLKRLFCVRHNRLAFKCCVPGRGTREGQSKPMLGDTALRSPFEVRDLRVCLVGRLEPGEYVFEFVA